jgi:hypothetical protein
MVTPMQWVLTLNFSWGKQVSLKGEGYENYVSEYVPKGKVFYTGQLWRERMGVEPTEDMFNAPQRI